MALKSKAVSNNWERVCGICEYSLYSAYSQIDPDFRIVLVCHETPILKRTYDQRLEIINVSFSPPVKAVTEFTMQDKWRKISIGMVRAGELDPDFVMIMDADDFVSKRLSQYANSYKEANGWIFEKGYKYQFGSRWIYFENHFNCGTNAIVNSKLIKFPIKTNEVSLAECVVLNYGHTYIKQRLEEVGTPLIPLPFIGSIYVTSHGDNDSHFGNLRGWFGIRYFIKSLFYIRFKTKSIQEEFSMQAF